MIGFVVKHVNLEEMEFTIDGVDEADALGEKMKGADAAVADAVHAFGDFVVDVAGGEDGAIRAAGFGFIEPTLDPALVSVEAMSYFGIHSKSLSAGGDEVWLPHETPQELQGTSSFSQYFQANARRLRLIED